ncbi:MAG: hypothetical protein JRI97_13075 [Deltaproteobacteria bacterium]|nr:hypothetical protein [Deltaproteobacteria bacterium]
MRHRGLLFVAAMLMVFAGPSLAGAAFSNASLSGSYFGNVYMGEATNWATAFVTFTFDGAGSCTITGTYADNTTASQAFADTGTYTVSSLGYVELSYAGGGDHAGYLKDGGDVLVVANLTDQTSQEVGVVVKKGSGMSTADLNGTYHAAAYVASTGERISVLGTFTFDGLGAYTGTLNYNSTLGGTGTISGSGTYSVAADGTVTLTGFPDGAGQVMMAGLSSDGNVVAMANVDEADDQVVATLVKKGSGYSAASLSGKYHVSVYAYDGGVRQSILVTITFDGAGGFTYSGTVNDSQGGVGAIPATNGTYTVAADGTGTLDLGQGDTMEIALLSDATMAVGATLASGSDQEYAVVVKNTATSTSGGITGGGITGGTTGGDSSSGCFIRSLH